VGQIANLPCSWQVGNLPHNAGETPAPQSGYRLARRAVLCGAIGAAWAAGTRAARAEGPHPLRPPGARAEADFVGLCIRCGNCVRACPAKIVQPDPGKHGLAGFMAPILHFRADYCREDCTRCMDVCPSGALTRLSLEEKRHAPVGLPRVDMAVCLLGDDRECSVCRNECPYDAITFVFSETDYTLTPQIDPAKCPGCGACEAACPTAPHKAIVVHPYSSRSA
jgi:ferredoxin-type protein NapF